MQIWKKIWAHLETDLLGILQFAFMPARADNDAGGWVFGGNLWMQARPQYRITEAPPESEANILFPSVFVAPTNSKCICRTHQIHPAKDWQHNM